MIASCGCEVSSIDELIDVEYDDEEVDFDAGEFKPIIVIGAYCPKCAAAGIKGRWLRLISALAP